MTEYNTLYTVDLFSVAKSIKNYLLDDPQMEGEQIWLFEYPTVSTTGSVVNVTHNSQDDNFARKSFTIELAVKDQKELKKSILTKFERMESKLVGNMKDLSDGAGKYYRILRLLPFGDRITEASSDKINIYHYRLYQAIIVDITPE